MTTTTTTTTTTTPSTSYEDRKFLARTLDVAAGRADMIGREPATGKQVWYLAGLMLDRGVERDAYLLDTNFVLTKREASRLIDWYRDDSVVHAARA